MAKSTTFPLEGDYLLAIINSFSLSQRRAARADREVLEKLSKPTFRAELQRVRSHAAMILSRR